MADFNGQCAGHQLMMNRLIQIRLRKLLRRCQDAAAHKRRVEQGIDLIEGQPVLHFIFIPAENRSAVPLKKSDQLFLLLQPSYFCASPSGVS